MCIRIAQEDMAELHTVFEAAKKLDPMAASDIRVPPPTASPARCVFIDERAWGFTASAASPAKCVLLDK